MNDQALARNISMVSLGLGFAELLAPRHVARWIGVNDGDHDTLIRLLGLREITSGLGIMQGNPAIFLWSRVAGDAMDLSLLAAAMRNGNNDRKRLNIATAVVAGITVLDIAAAILHSRDHSEPGWRLRDGESYPAGIESGDPVALRASCDEAMTRHQSGHVFAAEDDPSFNRLTPGANPLDQLAGNDDGLESSAPAGDSRTGTVPGPGAQVH
jgi:hypothetical protein